MKFLSYLIKVAHLHLIHRMRYLIEQICGGKFSSGSSHVCLICLFLDVRIDLKVSKKSAGMVRFEYFTGLGFRMNCTNSCGK